MSADDLLLTKAFEEHPVEGLDYTEGLSRFLGRLTVYMRVVRAFIASAPAVLEELAQVSQDTLSDYAVRVHGFKGSCLGISANLLGEQAKELELAAKAADWQTVEQKNPLLIKNARQLLTQLTALAHAVECSGEAAVAALPLQQAPKKELLTQLLTASKEHDLEVVRATISELGKTRYSTEPNLLLELNEHLANLRFDLIAKKMHELLL